MKLKTRTLSAVSAVAISALALGGCSQFSSPQKVCAATDTIENLQTLLDSTALKGFSEPPTNDNLKNALTQLWKDGVVKLDLLTFGGEDRETKKITCHGQIEIKLTEAQRAAVDKLTSPTDVGSLLAMNLIASDIGIDKVADVFKDGQASLNVDYQRQPTADGKDYVYSFDRSDQIESALRAAAVLQAIAQKTVQTAAPAADTPPPTPSDEDKAKDAALAQIPAQTGSAPSFESYPVAAYSGPTAAPDFSTAPDDAATFKSRIAEGMKGGANYAGNLTVIQFGCGTECSQAIIADVKTGKLYDFPLGGEDYRQLNLSYRIDSGLLNAQWQESASTGQKDYCIHQSFTWGVAGFAPMPKTKTEGECTD